MHQVLDYYMHTDRQTDKPHNHARRRKASSTVRGLFRLVVIVSPGGTTRIHPNKRSGGSGSHNHNPLMRQPEKRQTHGGWIAVQCSAAHGCAALPCAPPSSWPGISALHHHHRHQATDGIDTVQVHDTQSSPTARPPPLPFLPSKPSFVPSRKCSVSIGVTLQCYAR